MNIFGWLWDGTTWVKAKADSDGHLQVDVPSDVFITYAEKIENLNTPANENSLFSTTVPSGQIYVVTQMEAHDVQTNLPMIIISLFDGESGYPIAMTFLPGANVPFFYTGNIVLSAGYSLVAGFVGCTEGDWIYFYVIGYKRTIT